jgi:hypothetical protein
LEEDKIQGLLLRGEVGEQKRIPEVLWQKKGKVQGLLPQGERGSKNGYLNFSGGRRVRSRVSSPRGREGKQERIPDVLWRKKSKVVQGLLPQEERGSKRGYLKFSRGRRVRSRVPHGEKGSLKGQCHEIFCFWFFYESVSPNSLIIL